MIKDMIGNITGAPPWVILLGVGQGAFVVLAFAALLILRRRAAPPPSPAGEIDARKQRREQRIDTAIMSVVIPGIGAVLAAYAICTFEGMTAFAEDQLGWNSWLKYVPWGTADAAGIIFTLLRIYSVRKRRLGAARHAGRAVAAAMLIAAGVQLTQGGDDHKFGAGLFLAGVAIFGGFGLHVVIEAITDQKAMTEEEAAEAAARKRPAFGDRWVFAPVETLLVLRCLALYPLPKGTEVTVQAALDHRKRIRGERIAERGRLGLGWWPLVSTSSASAAAAQFEAGLETNAQEEIAEIREKATAYAEELRATAAAEVERIAAELAEAHAQTGQTADERDARIAEIGDELAGAQARAQEAEHRAEQLGAQARAEAERWGEQRRALEAEHRARIAQMEAEHAARIARAELARTSAQDGEQPRAADARGDAHEDVPDDAQPEPKPFVDDETAVQRMLDFTRNPAHPWTYRSVADVAGVAQARKKKLTPVWAEHVRAVTNADGSPYIAQPARIGGEHGAQSGEHQAAHGGEHGGAQPARSGHDADAHPVSNTASTEGAHGARVNGSASAHGERLATATG